MKLKVESDRLDIHRQRNTLRESTADTTKGLSFLQSKNVYDLRTLKSTRTRLPRKLEI